MLRAVTGVLAVAAMMGAAACSASDESNESAPGACPASPTGSSSATAGQASPGAAPTTSASKDAGVAAINAEPRDTDDAAVLADSPVTRCDGHYQSSGKVWLHRTPEGCMIGEDYVITADGKAKTVNRKDGTFVGTWTGDRFYFEVETNSPSLSGTGFKAHFALITGNEE